MRAINLHEADDGMKIARLTGTVTATIKEERLGAVPLVIADVEDGRGNVVEAGVVAANACGAGRGDLVLLAIGSAARISTAAANLPVDATVIAIIDSVDVTA